jgi:ferredoxin-NADP reductase
MAEVKVGRIVGWQKLSPILSIFRLTSEPGSRFPDYLPGQYIALRRENCKLTKKVAGSEGRPRYVGHLDESTGSVKLGPITHSYSIASAPFESRENGHLEFYVVLELDGQGTPGRLTGSLFEGDPPADDKLVYVNRITGTFTLDKRANGLTSVLLVGTGTGLAPFISMIKQLHFNACHGSTSGVQYTLLHTNRTYQELAYHEELIAIEAAQRFDFAYVASVSRPTPRDFDDPRMGRGRANNLLRHMFEMPLKEEEEVQALLAKGGDASRAKAALEKTVKPALPGHISLPDLRKRLDPQRTVILTCGNPPGMEDTKYVADTYHIHFEKEDW